MACEPNSHASAETAPHPLYTVTLLSSSVTKQCKRPDPRPGGVAPPDLAAQRAPRRRGQGSAYYAKQMGRRRWLVLAGASVLSVVGAILAFALRADGSLNRGALGLIVLIGGLAGLLALGAVQLSSKAGSGSSPAATERLSALIQNAGAALTIALALLFSFIVALVALAGAQGEGRVTVATAAFSAIGTIAGTYSGLRLGAHGKEHAERGRAEAERGRAEAEQARQESELAAERVAHGKEHAERGRDEAERARQESELVVEQVATKVGEDPVKQARGEVAHRRSGGQSGPIASSGPLQGGL